jgi:hypothetical protein
MKAIRVVGCILAALQFVLTVLFVYMLYVTKLVPFKMLVLLAVVMAISSDCCCNNDERQEKCNSRL